MRLCSPRRRTNGPSRDRPLHAALLWWALDPGRLSRAASEVVAEMERHGGFASSISIWELGIKLERGKLELPLPLEELVRRLQRGRVVELIAVDAAIWMRSLVLGWDHADPADRVIVATAQAKNLPLLTKDEVMHAFGAVRCIW